MDLGLAIMLMLTVKHFIADFVIQTDWMIAEKGYYGKMGGIAHAAVHGFFTLVILTVFAPSVAVYYAFLDFVVHYHIDWAKMKIVQKYSYTPADKQFWKWVGVDQMLHYLTYIFIASAVVNFIGDV